MSPHLRVLGRRAVDHAVERLIRSIQLEIRKDTLQYFPGPRDEILIPNEMRAVLALWPRSAQIADRAVSQERGEVRIGLDVRRPKRTAPELLIERKHRAVDVAKVPDEEDLFRSRIELPNEPWQVVGSVLLRHVFDVRLTLTGRDAQIGLLSGTLAESGEILDVLPSHPFPKTGCHRDRLGIERVVANPLLVGLEMIG